MDLITTLTAVVTGFGTTAITLAGVYFWVKRNKQKLSVEAASDVYDAQKTRDDDAIKRWQDFAEYQQKTFRQKNEEQDGRLANMQREHDSRLENLFKKLDDMHHAHLKCERESMEREMTLKREASERDLELKVQQRKIDELQKDLEKVKHELTLLSTKVEIKKE